MRSEMMKIIIKTLMCETFELIVDANTNIRELRTKVGNVINSPWEGFNIVNMLDKDGTALCSIYCDDPADDKLVDFIRREVKKPDLQVEELTIFIVFNLGRGFYRPTKHNPQGISALAGAAESKTAFFQSAVNPEQKESFSARLKRIGITSEDVPDHLNHLLDPITEEVMNNPVLTSNQRTFDLSSLERVNYIDPYSRQQLSKNTRPNLRLRSEIEKFVTQQEKIHTHVQGLLVNNDEKLENSLFRTFKRHS